MAKKAAKGATQGVSVTEWFCEQHGVRAPKAAKRPACPTCGKALTRSTWTMSGA